MDDKRVPAVVWRMVTPDQGNVIYIEDAEEAERFKRMDGREVRPYFADDVPRWTQAQIDQIHREAGELLAKCKPARIADEGIVFNSPAVSDEESTRAFFKSFVAWFRRLLT